MVIEKIIELFEKNKEVRFKILSLSYILKQEDNYIIVYPEDYPTKNYKYKTLEDALNYYTVYNESIIENADKIVVLEG